MEQERKLVAGSGHPSPVHPDKPSTDHSYHRALDHLLKEVAVGRAEIMVATHNQGTVEHALNKMQELGLSTQDGKVTFGQLLGMADHLTYSLVQAGYVAHKVVPYGSMDVIAFYLARRGLENRGVIKNAQTERLLYARELKRRLLLKT